MSINRLDIQIRDPFVLPVPEEKLYYLFGTTDPDPWKGAGVGFDTYQSADLETWEGPLCAFRPEKGFWATRNFWAPEVHRYGGFYYMFASFIAPERRRGTQILRSAHPGGPYLPHSDGPVTPKDWACLDGTLYVDEEGAPWIVFCHEWVQVHDGEICALRLAPDLAQSIGEPRLLFKGSAAAWTKSLPRRDGSGIVDARVTDGPFAHKTAKGGLILLWSSLSPAGYALGAAVSESGSLFGPWVQEEKPLVDVDGGHGMVFQSFDGRLYLTYHKPNNTPMERFHYVELLERGNSLKTS
ncbi:MAG: family 43 glycosylhydrolase [Anaerolineae bacterium]|nr:family 43 glycosylhydrolase [Anaerolineae bacterium]